MSEAVVEQQPGYHLPPPSTNEYANLFLPEEDKAKFESADHERFVARAADIITTVSDGLRDSKPLHEAIGIAIENYIGHPDDDEKLQKFSHLIVNARKQAMIQDQLNEDRRLLHSGTLSTEDDISRGKHYDMLRREACEYNHELRKFIEGHSGDVTRDELTGWLSRASQGRNKWAEGEITGAVSEAAVHMALQGMPELRGLRHGTVDEDLRGLDFVGQWQGRLVTFDAKTGDYLPLTVKKNGHMHIELSVPRIVGFRLTPHDLDNVRYDARHAMHAFVDLESHGSQLRYSSATPKHV